MKPKFLFLITGAIFAISLTSCDKNNSDDIIGKWDDNIHLSTRSTYFDINPGVTTVTTENEWWWFSEVNIGEKYYTPKYQTNMFDKEYITIVTDWLTVERLDGKSIQLTVEPNLTGLDRTATVVVQAGNYFDYITVTQAKEELLNGKWSDNIHLSTRSVDFDSNEGSATVTTEDKGWWFNGVSIDDNKYYRAGKQPDMYAGMFVTFVADWLTVKRPNMLIIELTVEPNLTGVDRTAVIGLQAGNYFDSITVTQTKD